jgi:hypothetical protein
VVERPLARLGRGVGDDGVLRGDGLGRLRHEAAARLEAGAMR